MPKKKGGKVQGRAKQKVKAQNAHSGGKAPWMKKFARSFDDEDDNDSPMFRGFAQRSGESTPRESGLKLRHQSIAFVSAGTNTPVEKEDEGIQEEEITVALEEQELEEEEEEIKDEAMQTTVDDDVDDSTLETTMVTDTDVDIAQGTKAMHIHEHAEAPIPALDGTVDSRPDAAPATLSKPPTPPQEETLSFVVDTEGDPSLSRPSKSQAKVPARPASPTPSDSSEEVILFHGRNNPKVVDDPIVSSRDSSKRQQAPKPLRKVSPQKAPAKPRTPQPPAGAAHVTDELLAALLGGSNGQGASDARGWAAKAPKWDQQLQSASEEFTPAPTGSWWRKGAPRPDLDPSPSEKEALETAPRGPSKVAFAEPEEDKGAEETIASLQAEWDQTRRDKKKAKQSQKQAIDVFEDIEESDVGPTKPVNELSVRDLVGKTSRRGKRGRKRSNKLLRDLQSDQTDDDEAAYNDYMENLRAQIEAGEEVEITGIRSAEGGPSLVVDGRAVDESEVLDGSTRQANFDELRMMDTDSESDDDELGMDMDDLEDEDDENASEFDSSDLEEELYYNEQEQWEDEDDLRQRRIDAMDDETLARLWAKQAELGISDDDLVIDDGAFMEVDDLDGFGDLDQAKAGLADLANSSFAQSTSKRGSSKKKNGGFSFPSASALADSVDQYGDVGFDIMDFERPSLKPKRGRKGKLPPELDALSDDDLKDEMLGHWSNDREKKRLKKAEREELRMQGLLGAAGKKGKADLGQKYQEGMTMPQIHEELRAFLQDAGKTTRAFPPMDKHDRKALHELANALNLKSKSVGAGKNRAPVLYKTARSADVSDAMFRRVAAASNRGFLKNSAFKGKKPKGGALPKAQRGGKGRGADTGSTGLRHGDVVGGGAKEIGRENFGHRLMEKMGWQKGTALGKEGSGLLTPVEQIMRTGRSGLG